MKIAVLILFEGRFLLLFPVMFVMMQNYHKQMGSTFIRKRNFDVMASFFSSVPKIRHE